MSTLGPRSIGDALVPRGGRVGAAWAAPAMALAGAGIGALAPDACASGLSLPASALMLTVGGTVLWAVGLGRARRERDRTWMSIAVALTLLSIASLQQLLLCLLGRSGFAAMETLRAGGLLLLGVALVLELHRRRAHRRGAR